MFRDWTVAARRQIHPMDMTRTRNGCGQLLLHNDHSILQPSSLNGLGVVGQLMGGERGHQTEGTHHVRPGGSNEPTNVSHCVRQVELGHHPSAVRHSQLEGCGWLRDVDAMPLPRGGLLGSSGGSTIALISGELAAGALEGLEGWLQGRLVVLVPLHQVYFNLGLSVLRLELNRVDSLHDALHELHVLWGTYSPPRSIIHSEDVVAVEGDSVCDLRRGRLWLLRSWLVASVQGAHSATENLPALRVRPASSCQVLCTSLDCSMLAGTVKKPVHLPMITPLLWWPLHNHSAFLPASVELVDVVVAVFRRTTRVIAQPADISRTARAARASTAPTSTAVIAEPANVRHGRLFNFDGNLSPFPRSVRVQLHSRGLGRVLP
mmetsp:Transcript_11445/g.32491  ORF Transcript_11445/g.32491 Transcript_11445/m.32491 type:complete len:377 (-) Transcript_11445:4-1134(-)